MENILKSSDNLSVIILPEQFDDDKTTEKQEVVWDKDGIMFIIERDGTTEEESYYSSDEKSPFTEDNNSSLEEWYVNSSDEMDIDSSEDEMDIDEKIEYHYCDDIE